MAAPSATLGGDVMHTRFLIGLPKEVEYRVFSLNNPHRVIVDIAETALQLPPQPEENIAVGLVRSFHAGGSAPGKSRVVIEVIRPVVVEAARIVPSEDGKTHRLALDIVPVAAPVNAKPLKTASLSSLGRIRRSAASCRRPAVRPDEMAARAFKPIIVIDPGHGGDDSGAMKNGVVEKDVVLAFSKMLRDKLEKSGRYKVHMTRDTDVFVPLDKRVDYAEEHRANLFIAVHADYAGGNSKARGATIYSLRENVANALQRSAKGEVKSAVLTKDEVETMKKASLGTDISAVKSILSDLAGREVDATQERTNIFTRSGDRVHGHQHGAARQAGPAGGVPRAQDGAVPVGADRARLRHEQGGRPAAGVGHVARQGLRLHHDRGRELLRQPVRPPADVAWAAARTQSISPENMKSRPRKGPASFYSWPASGRTPCRQNLNQVLLGGCEDLRRHRSTNSQSNSCRSSWV